jgi:hypothetical protein
MASKLELSMAGMIILLIPIANAFFMTKSRSEVNSAAYTCACVSMKCIINWFKAQKKDFFNEPHTKRHYLCVYE